MECVLCLEVEDIGQADRHIQINSEEGRVLDIQRIVEKHFWLRLDNVVNSLSKSTICQSCWQSLRSFNEFYLRIEHAHNNISDLSDTVNPLAACWDNLVKEEEEELNLFKPLPAKRRRGRPRKTQNGPESTEQFPLLMTENLILDIIPTCDVIKKEDEFMLNASLDIDALASNDEESSTAQDVQSNFKEDANEMRDMPPKRCRGRGRPRKVNKIITKNQNATPATRKSPRVQKSTTDEKDNESSNSADEFSHNEGLISLESCTPDERSDCDDAETANTKGKQRILLSKQFDEFIAANYKLICCLCQQPLHHFTALKTHFRTQHGIRGYAMCCDKKLFKRGVLVDHIKTHLDPQYFKCPRCDRVMADRRCLNVHLKTHDDKRERIYCCNICSKSFFRHSIYLRHVLMHLPEGQKNVACPQCDKTFATNYTMRQHLRLVHLNMYAKICDICGKSYRGREAFRRHQEEHEGVKRTPIQCDLCGSALTTKYGLARHMKVMHTKEYRTPQVCGICSKVSPSVTAHQRHMKYMHTMERKHACPMCVKAFKRATDLKEHMTTHTGEVLYTCPHCPKTFNSNANMHSHRKKVHRKEWEEKRLQRFRQSKSDRDTGTKESIIDVP